MAFLWQAGNVKGWRGKMESRQVPDATHASNMSSDEASRNPLAGELLDLYVAMIVVIPLAFFLKSLWSF